MTATDSSHLASSCWECNGLILIVQTELQFLLHFPLEEADTGGWHRPAYERGGFCSRQLGKNLRLNSKTRTPAGTFPCITAAPADQT
jgi:hypothetical protein